jgi:hypothetical protein
MKLAFALSHLGVIFIGDGLIHLSEKFHFLDPIYTMLILGIAMIGMSFFMDHGWREIVAFYRDLFRRISERRSKLILIGIIFGFVIGGFLFYYLPFVIWPAFQITDPASHDSVDDYINVHGIGATSGSQINVSVIDDTNYRWDQSTVYANRDGTWSVPQVKIGRSGEIDKGKLYTIIAVMTEGEKKFTANPVEVIRN